MDWILKTGKKIQVRNKKRKKNVHTKEARRLKYCEKCKRVWEIGFTGSIHSYDHLPTYGLPRKTCKMCLGESGKPYKQRK